MTYGSDGSSDGEEGVTPARMGEPAMGCRSRWLVYNGSDGDGGDDDDGDGGDDDDGSGRRRGPPSPLVPAAEGGRLQRLYGGRIARTLPKRERGSRGAVEAAEDVDCTRACAHWRRTGRTGDVRGVRDSGVGHEISTSSRVSSCPARPAVWETSLRAGGLSLKLTVI